MVERVNSAARLPRFKSQFHYWQAPLPHSASGFFCLFVAFFLILFIFWLRSVFIAARGLSLVGRAGVILRCGVRVSHCSGFSCCGARALGARASIVAARRLSSCGSQALERRLSSCCARA